MLSRRKFIGGVAAGGIGLGLCGPGRLLAGAASGSLKGGKMQFGLVTYLWGRDWSLPTLLKNCEQARVYGVELRTTHAHGVERDLSAAERREVRRRFKESPVSLVGLGSNERFDHPDPERLKKAIEATKDFVRLSHDVAGSGVKVKPNSFHENVPRETTIRQIGESLHQLGEFAKDFGQEIRLEVHGECSPLPIIRKIMDRADHPNVGVCWNSNQEDLRGEGLEHNFRLVQDFMGATAHVRRLDSGNYPYQELIDLFVGIDYNGWLLLEARDAPEDRVYALLKQKQHFERMVYRAQANR